MSLGYTYEMSTADGWILAWSEALPVGPNVRGVTAISDVSAKTSDRTARTAALVPQGKDGSKMTANEAEWLAKIGDMVKAVAEKVAEKPAEGTKG
jgi:hypothetical protein